MTKKAFFKLLPIFALYFLVFFIFADNSLDYGDQRSYAQYAENLSRGFYAPADTLDFRNGPGYPLLLTPFAFLDVPWFWAKLLNPVFLFLSTCFLYVTLKHYMSEKTALIFAYLFCLYPPPYWDLRFLMTEPACFSTDNGVRPIYDKMVPYG